MGRIYVLILYSVLLEIENIRSESEFHNLIMERTEHYLARKLYRSPSVQEIQLCYKMLRYIMGTQRKHLFYLTR